MKVLVLNNMAPFVKGGAEELADHLIRNLRLCGADAELCRIPFSWNPPERLIDEMVIAKQMRLFNVDRVIALKFPAYLVPWDNKVVWLLHQFRQAYDLLDANQSDIPREGRGQEILTTIYRADTIALSAARAVFTNSPTTSARLLYYNKIDSKVLRPPLNDSELFGGGEAQNYVIATGRVNAAKRQLLLVRALRYAPTAQLVIAGPPDSESDAQALRAIAKSEGVDDRVYFDLRFLPREDLAQLVNNARAVAYLPFDEDSYGYCTMEAFHAGKPVITTDDSGGVLDLVKDRENGLVVSPVAERLGEAIEVLFRQPALAERLGRAGQEALIGQKLSWPSTIERLLS